MLHSTSFIHPRSFMQFGLATEISDEQSGLEHAVRGAKMEVLRWVYESAGLPRPEHPDIGQQFENNDRPGVKYGVAVGEDAWVAKVEHADGQIPGRSWTTEICIVEGETRALLGVRNLCTSGPNVTEDVPISTPRFVRFFARRIGLLDADVELGQDPWHVQDEQDLQDLYDLITSSDRFLPVILATEPYRINALEFARRSIGVAHVVTLPDSLSRKWSELIGKEFAAYLGAVRTYNAGIDFATESPFSHPLMLGGKIASFTSADGTIGAAAFEEWLLRKAYRSGSQRIMRDERFPRFSQLRGQQLDAQRRTASASDDAATLIQVAELEVEQFRRRADEAEQLQAEALSENQTLNEENRELRSQAVSMQMRIDSLIAALQESGREEAIEIPDDLEGLREWSDRYLAGRVILLQRAYNEAKDSVYESPEDIYNALLWLAQLYWPAKTSGDEDGEIWDRARRRLAELGMEYAGSIDPRNAGEEYKASYRGKRWFMNMAIKKGNSRERRYCMRIYTFWDEDAQATVVGSLPAHLDNTMS